MKWLAAFGANPCFLVSLYDHSSGRGALAHIDGLTDPALTLRTMQGGLFYPTPETEPNYQATLVGGSNSPLEEMVEILKEVREMQVRKLKIDIWVGDIRQNSASLALDLADGSIYKFSPHPSLTSYQPIGGLGMQMRSLQGKRTASADRILGF